MDGDRTNSPPRWWKEPQLLCLLAVIFLSHFIRFDTVTIRGEEPRRIAIGQEMLRTGDWIVPKIQGDPVYFRPPLQNWLIALSIAVFGDLNHLSVRFPGMMAVLLTCGMLYAYGRQFVGPLGAFSAAAAYATMVQVLNLGRLAETESVFTCLVCVTLLTWHRGFTSGWSDWRLWTTAYALAGLGALAKGMQAPVYLFTTSAVYLWWVGSWRRFFTPAHLLGLVTFALVFSLWFVPYVARMGWDKGVLTVVGETTMRLDYSDRQEVIGHLLGYPLWVVSSMLPWSLLLLGYLRRDLRASLGPACPMIAFAACAALVSFPTCWAVPSANPRYFMPLYPCVALLVGVVIEHCLQASDGSSLRRHWTWGTCGVGVLLVGLAVVIAACKLFGVGARWLDAQPAIDWMVYVAVLAIAGCVHVGFCKAQCGVTVFASALVLALTGSLMFQNSIRAKSVDVESPVAALKQAVPENARFYSFEQANHRFAFYLNRHIARLDWPSKDRVPAGSYFCFEVDRPEKTPPTALPFRWDKVAVLWMDRYPDQLESFVVVGRRVADSGVASRTP